MIKRILDLPPGSGETMTWSSEDSDNEQVQARRRLAKEHTSGLSVEHALADAVADSTLDALKPAPAKRACSRIQACGWRDVYRCQNRIADQLQANPADDLRAVHVSLSSSGADACDIKNVLRVTGIDIDGKHEDDHCGLGREQFESLFFTQIEPTEPVGIVGVFANFIVDNPETYVLFSDAGDGDAARFLAHAAVMRIKRYNDTLGVQLRRAMQYDDLGGRRPARSGLCDLLARFGVAVNEIDERRRVRAYLKCLGK